MNRFYGRATRAVTKSWQMYPIGLLFGLGFDTATEIALLATAGAAAAGGLPIYAILCLPILFAAGMTLLDTIDGAFMNFAYGWAFSQPIRKIFYNMTITALSVFVALLIGTIELMAVFAEKLSLSGQPWDFVSGLDLNYVGYAIVGLFVADLGDRARRLAFRPDRGALGGPERRGRRAPALPICDPDADALRLLQPAEGRRPTSTTASRILRGGGLPRLGQPAARRSRGCSAAEGPVSAEYSRAASADGPPRRPPLRLSQPRAARAPRARPPRPHRPRARALRAGQRGRARLRGLRALRPARTGSTPAELEAIRERIGERVRLRGALQPLPDPRALPANARRRRDRRCTASSSHDHEHSHGRARPRACPRARPRIGDTTTHTATASRTRTSTTPTSTTTSSTSTSTATATTGPLPPPRPPGGPGGRARARATRTERRSGRKLPPGGTTQRRSARRARARRGRGRRRSPRAGPRIASARPSQTAATEATRCVGPKPAPPRAARRRAPRPRPAVISRERLVGVAGVDLLGEDPRRASASPVTLRAHLRASQRRPRPGRARSRRRSAAAAAGAGPAGPAPRAARPVRSSSSRFWKTPPASTTASSPRRAASRAQASRGRRRRAPSWKRAETTAGSAPRVEVGDDRPDRLAGVEQQRRLAVVDQRHRVAGARSRRSASRLELGRRLALVVDLRPQPAERGDARRRAARRSSSAARRRRCGPARRPPPSGPRIDRARQRRRQLGALAARARPRARRRPSATARAPPRRRRAAGPGRAARPARSPRAPPTSSSPPQTVPSGPRPEPSKIAPTAGPARRARRARRPGGRGGAGRRRARPPRARARSGSRGSRDGGRGRRAPARPRTGAGSGRLPPGTRSGSRSSSGRRCGGTTQARSPLARQKVLFSSAPQARIGRSAWQRQRDRRRHVAARAPQISSGSARQPDGRASARRSRRCAMWIGRSWTQKRSAISPSRSQRVVVVEGDRLVGDVRRGHHQRRRPTSAASR